MSHSHHNHGGMTTGSSRPLPTYAEFQQIYWAVIGSAIAFGAAVNAYQFALYRQRLIAAKRGEVAPAKPKLWLTRCIATMTAFVREVSDASVRVPIKCRWLRTPTAGPTFLVAIYLAIVVLFSLYGYDLDSTSSYSDLGYRTGYVAITQLPLVFLLTGKNNIIGWLTGSSYERVNYLHRWVARGFFLASTLHLGYWIAQYWPYPRYIVRLIRGEGTVGHKYQTGLITWVLFAWIAISSMTPIRSLSYEFFVFQHFASFTVFIVFTYLHLFPETKHWVWIATALFFFDRIIRVVRTLYVNLAVFHGSSHGQVASAALFSCQAEFRPVAHDTTKITIRNPPMRWTPGQHVLLSCHSLLPLQSHPFTIASIPTDGRMDFYVKAQKGGTRRFLAFTERLDRLSVDAAANSSHQTKVVLLEGPYGSIRPLRQFDSVIIFAGSTGATFTMPLLRDLVACWLEGDTSAARVAVPPGAVTRHIRYIWVIKTRGQLEWFVAQLSRVLKDVAAVKVRHPEVEVEISVYLTCDDSYTEENHKIATSNKSQGGADLRLAEVEMTPLSMPGEKQTPTNTQEIEQLTSSSTTTRRNVCKIDGTCCCRDAIDSEEHSVVLNGHHCQCSKPEKTASLSSDPSTTSEKRRSLHPGIAVLSGRPQCRNLIRKLLEQALGESAVVVCGPQSLVNDVRQSVVCLSDERAVHKGTGAQGIYLHTENFGY